ncbi:hypothetical protein GYMLUDRAFT_64351 [Collybiopsis luxurians FD-317 M1]|uniref:Uncharacterized protein n=1 Tax=Collybiopsis luxurians FD-317 M1 TaxID=944289 RepID=A0A0D0C2Z8_9AGAR|nr:hypothetical protein GYMLUDRAFT_64351 [Collybiopsis luxurians FD-317 M1]
MNGIKQEHLQEQDNGYLVAGHNSKQVKRAAAENARQDFDRRNSLGFGGYLNSETTDTQLFGFLASQSAGAVGFCEEEMQIQYGCADDDLYGEESQIPLWYAPHSGNDLDNTQLDSSGPICASTPSPNPEPTSSSSLFDAPTETIFPFPDLKAKANAVIGSFEWGPNTPNQAKLKEYLAAKYDDDFVFNLVAAHEDSNCARENFRILKQDEEQYRFTQKALLYLMRKAGFELKDTLHSLNPLRRGHAVVGFYMMRQAFELICHGGQARDVSFLKDIVTDGRVMLDVANSLVNIEEQTQNFIDRK